VRLSAQWIILYLDSSVMIKRLGRGGEQNYNIALSLPYCIVENNMCLIAPPIPYLKPRFKSGS
jgi:hypothetical protein